MRAYTLKAALSNGGLAKRGSFNPEPAVQEGSRSDNLCPARSEKQIICPRFKLVPQRQGGLKERAGAEG